MSTETNETIVKRFIEAANARDVARLHEILTPELAERWRQSVLPWLHGTFAGHTMMIKSIITSGDHAVVRITTSGLHSGEWHGIPATNKPWANDGVYFIRIADGRIVELKSLFNELDHARQLGATITPPERAREKAGCGEMF